MKRKVVLEFENTPSLIFVQKEVGFDFELYQDGKKVEGIRYLKIHARMDDATIHEIEYLTGATKERD